jgi:hypothetical protein
MRLRLNLLAVTASLLAACGGGGAAGPTVVQPPVTTLAPQPSPTPSPSPTASPCPDGACGNTNAVTRAQLRLYLLMDEQGRLVEPTPDPVKQVLEEPIPVGYTMRLDVTGKDANGDETNGRGQIQWFYSGEDLIHTNQRSAWQRDITVAKPGTWSVYVVFDGVSSNSITFTFAAR